MITFSVVTITYNAASVLQPTLDSVLMQDYPHVEHIIIDGASTDNTLEIAKPISSSLTRLRMSISYVFKASQTKDFMTQ